jgi:hypothetical protein
LNSASFRENLPRSPFEKSYSLRISLFRILLFLSFQGSYRIRNGTKPIPASAQVVENPCTPKAQNAGRVIIPKEVMTISGNGQGEYSFVVPNTPSVMSDGSLLIREYTKNQNQLLLFDKNGRFLRNLILELLIFAESPGVKDYFGEGIASRRTNLSL